MRKKICIKNIEGLQVKKIMRSLNIEYIEKLTTQVTVKESSSSTVIKLRKLNLTVNISELFQENMLEIMLNTWKATQNN